MEKGKWITTETGQHVFIKDGQTVEQAFAERFDDNFESDLEQKPPYVGEYGEAPTQYYREGLGYVSKQHYDKAVEQGNGHLYTVTKTTPPAEPEFLKNWKRIEKPEKIKESTEKVNPFYHTDDYEWTYNCQRCVVAWEMRYRGYDVLAKEQDISYRDNESENPIFKKGTRWSESFKHFEWKTMDYYYQNAVKDNVDIWESDMKKAGPGARFIVHVQWMKHHWEEDRKNYNKHVFNAIVNPQGEIEYYDGQNGKKVRPWSQVKIDETSWARVDHLELTERVKDCVYQKGEEPNLYKDAEEAKTKKEEKKVQQKENERIARESRYKRWLVDYLHLPEDYLDGKTIEEKEKFFRSKGIRIIR